MAIVQEFDLNMIPDSAPIVVHVNQYDEGEGRFAIHLYDGNVQYVPSAGAEAIIQGTKPDGKGFEYSATLSGSTVTANVTKQMTAVAGVVRVQVVITEGDDVTGTFVFGMDVQKSALPADADMSASEYQHIIQLMEQSEQNAEDSEAYANGTRMGEPVEEGDPAYENNSKYWKDQSGDFAEDSEAWAVGKRGGVDVPSTDDTYENNSKYYSEESYKNAEAWAVGTRGGVPVSSEDPAYHNNAKYWSDKSAAQTLGGLSDVDIDNPTNLDTLFYDSSQNKWINKKAGNAIGIIVSKKPDSTFYYVGDQLDLTGIKINLLFAFMPPEDVTENVTFNPANGTMLSEEGDITITATYRDYHTTFTVNVTSDVYGVSWLNSNNRIMSRTDKSTTFVDPVPAVGNGNGSSPFDNIMPWVGMEIVEDADAGTLVKIPKFWFKLSCGRSSNYWFQLRIANKPLKGFSVSPAHMDRGDGQGERDFVYVGAYHCGPDYKSTTGVIPKVSTTRADFRAGIHNLGSDIWQWDKAMHTTIQMLYIVEFANWDSQGKIGYGCSNSGVIENNGYCDSMIYHTGTNAADRTIYGHTRYRGIEDLWGNVMDMLDGLYYSSNINYANIILDPENFSDIEGGVLCDIMVEKNVSSNKSKINGFYGCNTSGFEWLFLPGYSQSTSNVNYANANPIPDGAYTSGGTSWVGDAVGGSYSQSLEYGLFYRRYLTTTMYRNDFGSRIMKLPITI